MMKRNILITVLITFSCITHVMAGQISVINPAAGSSIAGVSVSMPAPSTIAPSMNNIGILPRFKGNQSTQKPSVVIKSGRALLFQSLKDINTSRFSIEQKKHLISLITKNLNSKNLDQGTRDFLVLELQKLSLTSN